MQVSLLPEKNMHFNLSKLTPKLNKTLPKNLEELEKKYNKYRSKNNQIKMIKIARQFLALNELSKAGQIVEKLVIKQADLYSIELVRKVTRIWVTISLLQASSGHLIEANETAQKVTIPLWKGWLLEDLEKYK